jgi:hypothetical protein
VRNVYDERTHSAEVTSWETVQASVARPGQCTIPGIEAYLVLHDTSGGVVDPGQNTIEMSEDLGTLPAQILFSGGILPCLTDVFSVGDAQGLINDPSDGVHHSEISPFQRGTEVTVLPKVAIVGGPGAAPTQSDVAHRGKLFDTSQSSTALATAVRSVLQ